MSKRLILRREMRVPVALSGECRTGPGEWSFAKLHDLSTHGCSLTTRGRSLRDKANVMVRFAGLEAQPGTVRWNIRERAGVEFNQPLYPPVFNHICREK